MQKQTEFLWLQQKKMIAITHSEDMRFSIALRQ